LCHQHRQAWLDEEPLDAMGARSLLELLADQLRPVIHAQAIRLAADLHELVQLATPVHVQLQGLVDPIQPLLAKALRAQHWIKLVEALVRVIRETPRTFHWQTWLGKRK
jgi:hypothetical protein